MGRIREERVVPGIWQLAQGERRGWSFVIYFDWGCWGGVERMAEDWDGGTELGGLEPAVGECEAMLEMLRCS